MTPLSAQLHDGLTAQARSVDLEFTDSALLVRMGAEENAFSLTALRISPRMGGSDRFIDLPNGSQLTCRDTVQLDALAVVNCPEGIVSWLDARWWVALLAAVLTSTTLGLGYFAGLPRLVERVAARITIEQEQRLGQQAFAAFDKILRQSQLTSGQRREVNHTFGTLRQGIPSLAAARLEFRIAPGTGPNAFALPGGVVVVTDELVNLCQSQDELAGVLAHELGHLAKRHAIRSVLGNAGISVALGVISGDVSTVAVFSSFPAIVASLKYSRQMEAEADDYSMRLLASKGIAPENYAKILERLMNHCPSGTHESSSYLSAHPDIRLRIDRVRHFTARGVH